MTDQLRADYIKNINESEISLPNIARIYEGIGFSNCVTVNPICTPARTSLITGRYSHQIGMLDMSGDLSLQIPTFMQALQNEGYFTAGIGKFHFLQTWKWSTNRGKGIPLIKIKDKLKQFGFDYIWESSGKQLALKNYCDYCKYLDEKGLLEQYRDFIEKSSKNSDSAYENVECSEAWPFDESDHVDIQTRIKSVEFITQRPKDKPFYLFTSFCSPHKPYDPPQRYLDMVKYEETDDFVQKEELSFGEKEILYRQRHAAKALIKFLDDQIGIIIETLEQENLLDNTAIIFTSDHGDMLGDHLRLQKAIYWKQATDIPLAIRHPDYLYNSWNESPVEIIDICATILDIAEINLYKALTKDWPAYMNIIPCRSLLPILNAEKNKVRDYVFSESRNEWEMIRNKYFKYIYKIADSECKEEFYDLVNDPLEIINIVNSTDYVSIVNYFRNERIKIKDNTPSVQTSWAPLID